MKECNQMRLAMFQMANAGSVQFNLNKSLEAIRKAAENQADMILFPEVQLTEFFPQFEGQDKSSYQVTLDSEIVKAFRAACKKYHIMAVPNLYLRLDDSKEENSSYSASSMIAKEEKRAYDASLMIGRDGVVLGIQKMVHIAQALHFYEQDYYLPSDDGFQVFDTPFGKIGVVVCFDRHYPESVRTETLMGADCILVPTVNTKSEPMEMFQQEIRVQAFQNSVFIAMCNRVGVEDDMEFAGESLVVSPQGDVLVKADDTEQLIYMDIDLQQARNIRAKKPYTTLRREEFYC